MERSSASTVSDKDNSEPQPPMPKPRRMPLGSQLIVELPRHRSLAPSDLSNAVSTGIPADPVPARPATPAPPRPAPKAKRPAEDATPGWGYQATSDAPSPPPSKKPCVAQLHSSGQAAAVAADSASSPSPAKPKLSAKDKGKGKADPPAEHDLFPPMSKAAHVDKVPPKPKAPAKTKAKARTAATSEPDGDAEEQPVIKLASQRKRPMAKLILRP
jgi:hypothetical protein